MFNINKDSAVQIKKVGSLLWEKDLASAFNGNLSVRVDEEKVLLTGTGTCLGFLEDKDLSLVTLSGDHIEGARPTSERLLHLDIYREMPAVRAVVHTHTTLTNAYFSVQDVFLPKTFEAEYFLGKVVAVDQDSVNVRDTAPVIKCLKEAALVALRRHGVVAVGKDLFEGFARIQSLEEQIRMEAAARIFALK